MHHKTKRLKPALVLFVTLLSCLYASAQTASERHGRIKSAIDSGDLNAAVTELNASRSSDPTLFASNNYDYLAGRLLERTGEVAAASSNYQSVVSRSSVLSQYALWHLAQVARSTGDLPQERERLRQLILLAPGGLLRDGATMRLGQSFFESQDYAAAVAALRPLSGSAPPAVAREALALLGAALLSAGKREEARDVFRRLVMQMPDASRPDDFALAAVRSLDLDSNGRNSSPAELPEAEHVLRASVYQFNRDFDAARRHYIAVVERYPQSPTAANALYQVGRGFYLQARYDEALKYFQQVLDRFPDNMSARDALGFKAAAYHRLKRTDDAVAAYRRFSERFPDAPNPERSFLNLIDALHEAGRHREALDWAQQTQTRFRDQVGESLALFAQMRIHLAQSSWPAVIADAAELRKMSDLGGTRVPSGSTSSEVSFLRAYALERLGRIDEAISEYLTIPDGRNEYHGKRATQRLLAIGGDAKTRKLIQTRREALRSAAEKAINSGLAERGRSLAQDALRLTEDTALRNETLELVLRAYEALPAYKLPSFTMLPLSRRDVITVVPAGGGDAAVIEGRADASGAAHLTMAEELFFLGLYDEGVPEFAAARAEVKDASNTPQPNLDYTIAVFSLRGGLPNRAVRFGEQVWKPIPQDYVLKLAPRDLVDLMYPLPYRESLIKHASPRGVDPRFVISIARQESRFQPDAKSVSAARGLMQFILATANDTAAQLGLRDFSQNSLYNPDTAILFGSQYLANLFKQFPSQSQAVAASYNGGPDNVARWTARAKSDEADRYVPEIGFSQTKDYVFKVMTNFWIYQELYDEKLERK